MTRLLETYRSEIVGRLGSEFGRTNVLALPRIEKVCLNMGVGDAMTDSKIMDDAVKNLTMIAGQKAVITKARRPVSNFKVREGFKVGCRVTLRGKRMYEFLDRLMNAAMPRIRDFRGVNRNGFDGQGNFSVGLDDMSIFPEIDPDQAQANRGLDVTIVIRNSSGPEESRRLLELMGMPFERAS
jgi:large subunit ribosomal protein L5